MEKLKEQMNKIPKLKEIQEKAKSKNDNDIGEKVSETNNDIDTDIVGKNYDIPGFVASNYKEETALEICMAWNDRQNLKLYLYCVNLCGTDKAKRIFELVNETPKEKIKVNRRAMFTQYMLKKKGV